MPHQVQPHQVQSGKWNLIYSTNLLPAKWAVRPRLIDTVSAHLLKIGSHKAL
jgi:hypothetical protein